MTTWERKQSPMGGYYEHARLGGRSLMIRHTANRRWVARVDGKPVRGSFATADAARTAAVRAAS